MENSSSKNFSLPNLTKEKEVRPRNKALQKAIENNDLEFISDFLLSENRLADVSSLSRFFKCKLLPQLVEFLDQPMRVQAIECVYQIMNDTGDVDIFCKTLITRAMEFQKLVYLKGKIDYLKFLNQKEIPTTPENEYNETE